MQITTLSMHVKSLGGGGGGGGYTNQLHRSEKWTSIFVYVRIKV